MRVALVQCASFQEFERRLGEIENVLSQPNCVVKLRENSLVTQPKKLFSRSSGMPTIQNACQRFLEANHQWFTDREMAQKTTILLEGWRNLRFVGDQVDTLQRTVSAVAQHKLGIQEPLSPRQVKDYVTIRSFDNQNIQLREDALRTIPYFQVALEGKGKNASLEDPILQCREWAKAKTWKQLRDYLDHRKIPLQDLDELCQLAVHLDFQELVKDILITAMRSGELNPFLLDQLLAYNGPLSGQEQEVIYNFGFTESLLLQWIDQKEGKGPLENKLRRLLSGQNPISSLILGICYQDGIFVQKDREMALTNYQNAANNGNAIGAFLVALIYQNDPNLANEYFNYCKQAADQNLTSAQLKLGRLYEEGCGCLQDVHEAFACFSKAADQGSAIGQFCIGQCYEEGVGVLKDLDSATHYYQLAAQGGSVEAQFLIGSRSKVPKERFEWIQRAAMEGYDPAQYQLGLYYLRGSVVKKKILEAKHWFELAAKQENANAQYELGKLHSKSFSKYTDLGKSVEYFQKAAAQHHFLACYKLGEYYEYERQEDSTAADYYVVALTHMRNIQRTGPQWQQEEVNANWFRVEMAFKRSYGRVLDEQGHGLREQSRIIKGIIDGL